MSVLYFRYNVHHRHYNAGPIGALLLVTPSTDDCGDVDGCSLTADADNPTNNSLLGDSTIGEGSRLASQQQQAESFRMGKQNITAAMMVSLKLTIAMLVLSAAHHMSFASPVPGDAHPTVGLTFNGFLFSVNVTTYANTSMDVRDMHAMLDANDFAGAEKVYREGKNSWRNQLTTPQVMRVPKLVIARDYGTEAFYTLASKYYSNLGNRYLDAPLSDALAGAGEYASGGPLAAVRAAVAKAWMLFYPVLYYYHEIDAGWRSILANNVPSNVLGAKAEAQDAVGCYLAPSVISGGRAAPGYNPWDVSAEVSKYYCTTEMNTREQVPTSKVNVLFHTNSIAINNLFDAAIASNSSLPLDAFADLRRKQQRLLNINQAAAWAHWRLVQPTVFSMGVVREQLEAINTDLHPSSWTPIANKKYLLALHLSKLHRALRGVAVRAGYDWSKEILNCAPSW
eukprot:gene7295-7508_t